VLRLEQRRRLLQSSAVAHDGVGRIVTQDGLTRMGGDAKVKAALAREECLEHRFIRGSGEEAMERKDDITGETPLITQTELGSSEAVLFLLQAGANANTSMTDGKSALSVALRKGRADIVELLLEFKANLEACDSAGRTPLLWMSQEGKIDVVKVLCKFGANARATDRVRSSE
jgi:hypothetical protein